MKGEILFEKMTGISDEYITEAALVAPAGVAAPKKKSFASLSRALNSGWGVACICLLLAIAAVVSILHWGLPGASVNPFPPAVDPNAPRYVYSMGSLHSFSYGESVDRPVERGEDIYLTVSVQNNGPAFQIRDSEWAQLSAVCVLQGDDSVTLEWRYSPRDGGNQPYWVQTGATETLGFVLTIPENATPGVYDLVLSYDGVKQVFGGALTVGDPTEESKPPYGTNDLYAFSFGYEPYGGDPFVNSFLHLETWVRNDSEPFTFTGSSMGFAPHAVLLHRETGYRIEGMFDATTDYTEVTVNKGDVGRVNQEFFIPADAPTGIYDLVLSFYGATQTFENVLTVSIPIQEEDHLFSFGYELGGDALTGTTYLMDTWVINEGEAFTYEGSSMGFAPTAALIHMETQYRIDGSFDMNDDHGVFTIKPGDVGLVTQVFFIPTDAPTGAYALQLFYGGVSKSFPGVVIVAEPTVEDNTHIDPDELWEVAEQYISQVVENTDPAHYTRGSITTTMFTSGEYSICFGFHVNLLDMTTEETLHITLNGQGQYLSHEQDPQTYSLFIPYITTEMVEAAKPPLYEHPDVPLRLKHQYGYAIQDGDLYLTYTCYAEPEGNYETALECLYSTQVFLYPNPQTE